MSAPLLNAKLLPYLKVDARRVYDQLLELGLDPDLAFTVVEQAGAEDIYDLEGGESVS